MKLFDADDLIKSDSKDLIMNGKAQSQLDMTPKSWQDKLYYDLQQINNNETKKKFVSKQSGNNSTKNKNEDIEFNLTYISPTMSYQRFSV